MEEACFNRFKVILQEEFAITREAERVHAEDLNRIIDARIKEINDNLLSRRTALDIWRKDIEERVGNLEKRKRDRKKNG